MHSQPITRWSNRNVKRSMKSASNPRPATRHASTAKSRVTLWLLSVNCNWRGAVGIVLNCNFMGELINGSHRPDEIFGFDLNQPHGDSLGVSELITSQGRKQYL